MPRISSDDLDVFKSHHYALVDAPNAGFKKVESGYVRRTNSRFDMHLEKRGKLWFAELAEAGFFGIERFRLATAEGRNRAEAARAVLDAAISLCAYGFTATIVES